MTTVVYEALGYNFATQGRLLLFSALLGAALGVLFDFFRTTRIFMKIPCGKRSDGFMGIVISVVSFFEDIAFFTVSAAVVTVFCFHVNHGSQRGFMLFSMLVGFAFYINTVGRITVLIAGALSRALWRFYSTLTLKIMLPVLRHFGRLAARIYKLTLGRMILYGHIRFRRRATERIRRELIRRVSPQGFFKKGIRDEPGTTVYTGKACNTPRVPVSDSYSGQHADKTQRAGRGTGKTYGTYRGRSGKHRRDTKQTGYSL